MKKGYIKRKVVFFILFFTLFLGFILIIYKQPSSYVHAWTTWYDGDWAFRRPINIENSSGSVLSNEDVLVEYDTASLVSASKLQSDCDDLRFIDSNDTTVLSYWIESGCNTSSTKIWVRIPSLGVGTYTINMYYGNPSEEIAPGTLTWSGNLLLLADTTCPSGWTRALALDDKFLYGSSAYGSTGGSSSHNHSIISTSSTDIHGTSVLALTGTTYNSNTSSHVHSSLGAVINSNTSVLPPYINIIVCYKNDFTIPSGLISLFNESVPSGWSRFTALDGYFPKASSTYGTTGGANTHAHSTDVEGITTDASSNTQGNYNYISASGGTVSTSGGYKLHKFTSNSSLSVTTGGNVEVLVVGGGGGGGVVDYTVYSQGGAGGGGGGGYTYNNSYAVSSSSSYTVTIGAGGAAQSKGSSSFFQTLEAVGGGGADNNDGQAGGCGGGGSNCNIGGVGSPGKNGGASVCPGAPDNATGGGGGGGAASVGSNSGSYAGGNGGSGKYYDIVYNASLGTSGYIAGGGGGGGWYTRGLGGSGGGGLGASNNPSNKSTAGVANTGGGGGGGIEAGYNGKSGGSGVVLVRYIYGNTFTTGNSHTHDMSSAVVSSSSHLPPYLQMIFGKNSGSTYVTDKNIVMTSVLPPLGWSRFTELDNKFPFGSSSYGTTGGSSTHTHGVTLETSGPSSPFVMITSSETGSYFPSTTHYHTASTTSSSYSNIPPYYSVIYAKRDISLDTDPGDEILYNNAPTKPTFPYVEGSVNNLKVADLEPEFSAIFNDTDSSDTGNYYQIQVNTNSSFTGTVMWDSSLTAITPITNGSRSSDISYEPTNLSFDGTTYYWRIRFTDDRGAVGEWSDTTYFVMSGPPSKPTGLLTDNQTNPVNINTITPKFSAIHLDPNQDSAANYEIEVNSNSSFTGTVMWDTGKLITAIANNSRSPDYTYAGTTLTGVSEITYYWRIRFWDTDDNIGEWSDTATFVDSQKHFLFEGIQLKGLKLK